MPAFPFQAGLVRLRHAARSLAGGRGWVLFAALLSLNVGNLIFHVVVSQRLGPDGYGAVASILSVLLAISIPVSAAQVTLTGEVARRAEGGGEVAIGSLTRRFVLTGCVGAAVCLLLSPALAEFLHLDSVMPLVWLALYLIPLSAGVAPWASLVGRRRFPAVASAVVAGMALRLGTGVLLLSSGTGVSGALAATFLGELAVASTLLGFASRRIPRDASQLVLPWQAALRGTVAVAGIWILVAMDTVLARHYLSAVDAGIYAAASMAARGALYLPQAVAAIALPSLATADAGEAARSLSRALLIAAVLGVGAIAGLMAVSESLLPVVFGQGFQAGPWLVGLLAIVATGAGMLNLLVQYAIVQRSQAAIAAWAGVVALPLLTIAWHDEPLSVATATLLSLGLALSAALVGVGRRRPSRRRRALDAPSLSAEHDLDLTVVVPFHRAEEHVRSTLRALEDALERAGVGFEVIAVADGCEERSLGLSEAGGRRVRCIALERHCGKGEALRAGLREGRGQYLGFIDSDGDLDPAHWEPFLALMRLYRPDVIAGSKRHPLSEVRSPVIRHLYSRGYQALAWLLFRLPVRDTQVGIKLFRRELLVDALPKTSERGFVFDLELLVAARRLGYRRLLEAPVTIDGREVSSVRARTVWRMLADTLAVAWRLHTGRYDDRREPTEAATAQRRPAETSALPAANAPATVGGEVTG